MIRENLETINKRIQNAQAKSPYGQEVKLVAVSKTKPESDIMEAYDAGIRDFGENKVQELVSKYEDLPKDIRWHLIGHLQRNKVKYIIGKTYLIHSVDSLRLAQEIEKEAAKKNVTVDILVQVNISGEESKFGVTKEEAPALVDEIIKMPHINLKGLMTIAPETSNPEEIRYVFKGLKELSIDIKYLNRDNNPVCELSMGMSGDFEAAIVEGATYVRIGSSIFGARNYDL